MLLRRSDVLRISVVVDYVTFAHKLIGCLTSSPGWLSETHSCYIFHDEIREIFCPSIHPSPVRPMCRYIIPCMLLSGHKFHTSSEHSWNCNRPKVESNTSSGFSLVNSAVNITLPSFAAERRAADPGCGAAAAGAVDRYLLRVRRSAANPPLAAAAFDWWDRLTDGQTDGRTPDRNPQ